VQLDLSENRITIVEGLEGLTSLHTINLAKNALTDAPSITGLLACPSLTNLDLKDNELNGEDLLAILGSLPNLVAVSSEGNPMCREISHFRKKCVVAIKKLRFMDRPVFEDERACSLAWAEGGNELERKVKKELQEKARNKDKVEMQDFRDWQAEMRRQKMEEMANPTAESIARKTEEQAFIVNRETEAKAEAAEEKERYRLDGERGGNVAFKEGQRFLNESEGRDAFGNVRRSASSPEHADEVKVSYNEIPESDQKQEEGETETEEAEAPKLYSFQGAPPGAKKIADKKEAVVVEEEEDRFAYPDPEYEEDDEDDTENKEEGVGDAGDDEDERQMRVDESLQIYRAQVQARKAEAAEAKSDKSVLAPAAALPPSDITVAFGNGENVEGGAERDFTKLLMNAKSAADSEITIISKDSSANGFYWTEAMDVKLARNVHSCVFDFDGVSESLKATLSEAELEGTEACMITAEACRVRWSELDVDDDSMMNDGPPAQTQVSKVLLNKGGGQLSFQELQRQVNSQPSNLKAPTNLPGFGDDEGDEDSDSEEAVVFSASAMRAKLATASAAGVGVTNFESLD
jgi:hypothetical protein